MDNTNNIIPVDDSNPEQFSPEYDEIDLGEFAQQCFIDIENEDIEEELRRFKKWQKNRAFYRGNQRGFWDSKKRTWVTVDIDSLTPSEASVLVINNQFRPQVKTLAKEFSRSQTRVRATAKSDSQDSVLSARFSDALIRHYQPKLMPESKRQIEAKYLLLCGNSFRYTIYDSESKSSNVSIPVKGKKTLPEYTKSVCADCGYKADGIVNDCPECNSVMETTSVPAKEMNNVTIDYKTVNAGDPKTEIVDPSEVKVWAGAKGGLTDTPFIRRRRFVKSEFILNTFPFYTPSENAKLSESAQGQWQFLDTSSVKDSANTIRGLYEYNQLWLDVSKYRRKKLKKTVKFKKQVGHNKFIEYEIPEGTILEEKFPEGMYICKVGSDILGYYPEDKNEVWKHTAFDINIDGFWGDGLEDSVMNQQIINEYTSLSVENVLYNASPKLVINPSLINPVAVTGKPKDMLLMSDNARKDTDPKSAFAQIEGMSLTQEVMVGIDNAKRDMREQTGALLGFNGQGDPNITTATGMSIARDSALALVSTPLAVRAETDEAWCWQIIRLVKKHWYDEKYKFLLGKYNEAEAEAFRDSVLDESINLFVEPNSWMPQTNYEKLQNLGAFLTAFNIPFGFLNPQVPEPIRNYAAQLYNVPFDFDELAPDIRIAQKRLDMAKEIAKTAVPKAMEAAKIFAVANKPEAGQESVKNASLIIANAMGVEEGLDDHAVFIDQYKKWLKTDEGQNANPILREAVKATMADHQAFLETEMAHAAQQQALTNMGAEPNQQSGWDNSAPEESPFRSKNPNEGVQDFSENSNKQNL